MTKYETGDKVRILEDQEYKWAPNGIYKVGEIHTVAGVDDDGDPWFEGDRSPGIGWGSDWFEKIEEPAPSHKYKVGDKVRILRDIGFCTADDTPYKVGDIHTVAGIDSDGDPWFDQEDRNIGHSNWSNWFEKVKKETPQTTRCDNPAAPHFWQFGDIVAIGENKGIVISVSECDYYSDLTIKTGNKTYFQRSDTVKFIRRSDFSN